MTPIVIHYNICFYMGDNNAGMCSIHICFFLIIYTCRLCAIHICLILFKLIYEFVNIFFHLLYITLKPFRSLYKKIFLFE